MSRVTITDLRTHIKRANRLAMFGGSIYFYREQGRNGYQAVDCMVINLDGSISCQTNVEAGTSRQCIETLRFDSHNKHGYIYPQTKETLTRKQALTACTIGGVDFSKDFHELISDNVDLLLVWAKLTRYRRPAAANGSQARYFFKHLQKLKNKA